MAWNVNKPKEKKWENTYYMVTKQHATKKSMGQLRNQERNLKYL